MALGGVDGLEVVQPGVLQVAGDPVEAQSLGRVDVPGAYGPGSLENSAAIREHGQWLIE